MKETIIHKGFINLVKQDQYEIVRTKGACAVLFSDEDGYVYLVNQYRPAIGKYLLEAPAETYDKKKHYSKKEYARNALREELGAVVSLDNIYTLGSFYVSPGYTDEKIDLFSAFVEDAVQAEQKLDANEDIKIVKFHSNDVLAIEDLKTRYMIELLFN